MDPENYFWALLTKRLRLSIGGKRHDLLLSKVIKMAVRAAAPPRRVEPFVGSKVLKVAIRASVPSGGIRLFGNNNKNNNKVLKVAKTITLTPYMQKAGDSWDISPQIFLDFPQNLRLRTRNQYCTQAIA